MDDEKFCIGAIVVAILMFGGIAVMTYVDEEGWPWEKDDKKEEVLRIQAGDEVTVDYTGYFLGPSGEIGSVFDTSVGDIARNDSIPKSPGFILKETYDDMKFTVVEEGEAATMIAGFNDAVIGMKVGETKQVSIPPEKGYPEYYDERVLVVNSTMQIPLVETLTAEEFTLYYPMVDLEEDDSFIHPFWGWDMTIVSHSPRNVTVINNARYGVSYMGFPWNSTVVDLSTERNVITIHHQVQEITTKTRVQIDKVTPLYPLWFQGTLPTGDKNLERNGYVTSVGGDIVLDFNTEVAGKTLVFQITVNHINRGDEE
ncbi:MAG: FKBP-type peptidyl-prolyl cis-trans isomerase [Thermoplasmatota archaeon]